MTAPALAPAGGSAPIPFPPRRRRQALEDALAQLDLGAALLSLSEATGVVVPALQARLAAATALGLLRSVLPPGGLAHPPRDFLDRRAFWRLEDVEYLAWRASQRLRRLGVARVRSQLRRSRILVGMPAANDRSAA